MAHKKSPNEKSPNKTSIPVPASGSKSGRSNQYKVRVSAPQSLSTWMTDLPARLLDAPIWKLTIPGSHDSGSYGLQTGSGIAPDRPDLEHNSLMRLCRCLTLPMMLRWTTTQTLSVAEQLEAGIRYFDLRVAARPSDDDYYFVHGLYGPLIDSILQDINTFLKTNPGEVVFVDLQHFYSMSDADHKKLIEKIVQMFGSRIVPYASQLVMEKFTLRYLTQHKQQVFIYYRDDSGRAHNPSLLWPSRCLPNPWANTMSRQKLMRFLDAEIAKRPPHSMFVTQGILTPTNNYVVFHAFSSLENDLSLLCNRSLSDWIKSQSSGAKGPNIIMCDFVEWNNYFLPIKIIELNNSLNKN